MFEGLSNYCYSFSWFGFSSGSSTSFTGLWASLLLRSLPGVGPVVVGRKVLTGMRVVFILSSALLGGPGVGRGRNAGRVAIACVLVRVRVFFVSLSSFAGVASGRVRVRRGFRPRGLGLLLLSRR